MNTKRNPLEACPECGCTDLYVRVEAGNAVRAKCDACQYSYSVAAPVAAAPELLAAVKDMADFIENVTDEDPDRQDKFFAVRESWRKAIAKAEG